MVNTFPGYGRTRGLNVTGKTVESLQRDKEPKWIGSSGTDGLSHVVEQHNGLVIQAD